MLDGNMLWQTPLAETTHIRAMLICLQACLTSLQNLQLQAPIRLTPHTVFENVSLYVGLQVPRALQIQKPLFMTSDGSTGLPSRACGYVYIVYLCVSLPVCCVGEYHAPAARLASQPPTVLASAAAPAVQTVCQQGPLPASAAAPAACCAQWQLLRQLPSELPCWPVGNQHRVRQTVCFPRDLTHALIKRSCCVLNLNPAA